MVVKSDSTRDPETRYLNPKPNGGEERFYEGP